MNVVAVLLALIVGVTKSTERERCEVQEIYGKEMSEGYLTSPNYPLTYPPNQDCLFNITASADLVIHLTFTHFHLEGHTQRSNQCLNDYLVVTVVDRQGREHVSERFCGSQLPEPLHTMQNQIYIRFHSSYTDQFSGFRVRYQFIPEESILEPASSYFDDDLRYLRYCGGHNVKKAFNGEIQSPGYPAFYPRNVTCNWLLRVKPGKKIYLRVGYLHLSPTMAECERASLYIIDGYRHDSTEITRKEDGSQVKFCGSQLYYTEEGMKSYLSTGNRLIVRFVTKDHPSPSMLAKYEEEGKPVGFRLVWTEVERIFPEEDTCRGFACKGGELCIDDGQNVCARRTQLCIDKSLTCNGINNCAENDNTDEEDCYYQHIIASACSVILLLILLIISVILWQRRRIRRRINERRRERLEVVARAPASLNDSNGKNAIIWESTRCSSINFDSLSDIHHHHLHYHQQRHSQHEHHQKHIALSQMNTSHSALL